MATFSKRRLMAVVLGAALLLWSARRRRRLRDASRSSSTGSSEDVVAGNPRFTSLPLTIHGAALLPGWAVAPPVFMHLDNMAVVSLVPPPATEEDAAARESDSRTAALAGSTILLVCVGPLDICPILVLHGDASEETDAAMLRAITQVLPSCPMLPQNLKLKPIALETADAAATPTTPFEKKKKNAKAAPPAEEVQPPHTPAFRFAAVGKDTDGEEGLYLFGLQGCFLFFAYIGGIPIPAEAPDTVRLSDAATAESIAAMLLRVCTPARLPKSESIRPSAVGKYTRGAPSGHGSGVYRVTCQRAGSAVSVVLVVPHPLRVAQAAGSDQDTVLIISDGTHRAEVSADVLSRALAAEEPPAEGKTTLLQLLAAEKSNNNDSANGGISSDISGDNENMFPTLAEVVVEKPRGVTTGDHTESDASGASNWHIHIAYHHPSLDLFFSIEDKTAGYVVETALAEELTAVYRPFGCAAAQPLSSVVVTLQYVKRLPLTWVAVENTDEEFFHNVKFHFTDWEAEDVECTASNGFSGMRCVHFTERRADSCCRTYVLEDLKKTRGGVDVIRWEADKDVWQRSLPFLQNFLDTLHYGAALRRP